MSHPYYTKLWLDTAKGIGETIRKDVAVQEQAPFGKREAAIKIIADLYIRYLKLVKNLDVCFDQVTQPQKRPVIRRLLDMSMARMLEMRNVLQQLDISDYSYFENTLHQHQMTPFDLETPAPRYFRFGEPRERQLMEIRDRIDTLTKDMEQKKKEKEEAEKNKQSLVTFKEEDVEVKIKTTEKEAEEDNEKEEGKEEGKEGKEEGKEGKDKKEEIKRGSMAEAARLKQAALERQQRMEREGKDPVTGELTQRGAIMMIQRHERARQGRVKLGAVKIESAERRRQLTGEKRVKKDMKKLHAAAKIIQRVWRGYITRQKLKTREAKTLERLGLAMPSYYSEEQQKIADGVCALRRKMQDENQINFENELALEYQRWMKRKGPWLREDLTDQIRDWFIDWYVKATMFPTYPTEEEGGGMAIVDKDLVGPEKFLQKKERLKREKELIKQGKKKMTDAQMDKKKLKELKKKEKKEKKKQAKERKKKMKAGLRLEPWDLPESDVYPELAEAYGEYKDFWRGRDETDDPLQRLEMDLLKEQVAAEGTRDIRLEVDEFMKLELERLNDALARDQGKKKKKGKKGKKGKKKKKKKKKQKPPKTLAEIWIMFDELVNNGIIKNYPLTNLKDFKGDYAYMNEELRKALTTPDPPPGLGEIRQVLMETCIMPLGSGVVHGFLPLVKSVCIIGMPRSGTTTLAHAVLTESGSLMFDFSSEAICNSPYVDKAELKRFIQIVGEVARFFQPSVFLIDGAEKPFYKKVPKEEKEMKPKLAVKPLKKLLKSIKQEDQILVLGVTNQPFAAKGAIKKTFEKWILLPLPDYSTVLMTWNEELMKHYLVNREFITTPLAIETKDYSLEKIQDAINQNLNLDRRLKLKNNPLTHEELLEQIFNYEQYTEKDKKKLMKWYNKSVPMVKYRNKVIAVERIDQGLDPPKPKKKK